MSVSVFFAKGILGGHYASVFMSVVSFGFTRGRDGFHVVFEWGIRRRYTSVFMVYKFHRFMVYKIYYTSKDEILAEGSWKALFQL